MCLKVWILEAYSIQETFFLLPDYFILLRSLWRLLATFTLVSKHFFYHWFAVKTFKISMEHGQVIQNGKESCTYIRWCQKFGIKVYWRLQFLGYLRTLSLKFQKARTKIEVVLTRQPSGQSQDNFNFGPSLLKGDTRKQALKLICQRFHEWDYFSLLHKVSKITNSVIKTFFLDRGISK